MPNYPNTMRRETIRREIRRETMREIVLPIVALVLFVLVIVVALTGISLHTFAEDCASTGGTYSIDGGTAWCRY